MATWLTAISSRTTATTRFSSTSRSSLKSCAASSTARRVWRWQRSMSQAVTVLHHHPVTLAERTDFHVIGEIIEPGSRVLDLGCGEGELLAWLVEHKGVLARGVEI